MNTDDTKSSKSKTSSKTSKTSKATEKSKVNKSSKSKEDAKFEISYEQTRKSLIARLDNWEDQRTWDEFYKTYWKLIYSVGLKSGLRSEEAFDVVQETILSIAKQSKKNLYDPEQGSFKTWLMNMARWRIQDQFRKRKKDTANYVGEEADDRKTAIIDRIEDPQGEVLERMWDVEWKKNLADAALVKVKAQVSPKQYQIFDLYVLKEWDVKEVQTQLGVSKAQVYLAKHRVGTVLKKELAKLDEYDQED